MKRYISKAQVLIEALPYMKKFFDKVIVVKLGGEVLEKSAKGIIKDLVLLHHLGIKIVIVHGGGREISREMNRQRVKPLFVNGLRVTTKKTMRIVEDVFKKTRLSLVYLFRAHKVKAEGLSGKENYLLQVKRKNKKLGYVGDVKKVHSHILESLLDDGYITVVSPIGVGDDNNSYNVNADEAAATIAVSLKAEKLTILTNVAGVMEQGDLVSSMTIKQTKSKIGKKVITGGMIPKVLACIKAVEHGCRKAHLINGLVKHAVLLEIFTKEGIGTEIVAQ
ncbi:acetylglutamate kinase [Candidatus Micrarchaeota archaeon]|nr:acetylglutamate kinase [Candidatus Micrarchaeota archaeon]